MKQISRDILWKAIIEDFFSEFLCFFYPEAPDIFDFSKDFEFLDKELEQMIFPSSAKNRIADKLVKVYTKDGKEKWVLIHLEIQGYEDRQFDQAGRGYAGPGSCDALLRHMPTARALDPVIDTGRIQKVLRVPYFEHITNAAKKSETGEFGIFTQETIEDEPTAAIKRHTFGN